MDAADLQLTFEEIAEDDVPELTAVMTRAFDDDARRNLGVERGGPPGYDDGEFFRQWLFGYKESEGYKILAGGRIVGALIVWDLPGGDNILGAIFVDPAYQNRGIGTRAWQFVETSYPQARSWRLETPVWAAGNHHFYEVKCGFHRVDAHDEFVVFQKQMPGRPPAD